MFRKRQVKVNVREGAKPAVILGHVEEVRKNPYKHQCSPFCNAMSVEARFMQIMHSSMLGSTQFRWLES
jgi:hypothetical protein